MIRIALQTFLIDVGLNLMFDNLIQNFAKPIKVSIGHNDPEYLIVGERLMLYFKDDSMVECVFNGIIDNYFFVTLDNGDQLKYLTSNILAFDRMDYDECYDSNGWIDINDDERIKDEQLIKWLKEKRVD